MMDIELKFEPRDIWVGLYWNWKEYHPKYEHQFYYEVLHFYICIVPMFPIIIQTDFVKKKPRHQKSTTGRIKFFRIAQNGIAGQRIY